MRLSALALIALATPAGADTFAERWPQPVAVEPVKIVDAAPPKGISKPIRHAHAEQRGFICHRQTFYRGHHRYWRCQR
jgi:hypothetical protein